MLHRQKTAMNKNRLEAFSDGVLAIIITIMVLELKVPHGTELGDLLPLIPIFLSYVLSFIYVGIYWNNHHHMLHASKTISGSVMLANLNLLFWLSLIPFTSGWMGENHFAAMPTALYGVILLMSGLSYLLLQSALLRTNPKDSLLAKAVGCDKKGKLSAVLYAAAVVVAFNYAWLSLAIYALVALLWIIPDRRIEEILHEKP